MRRLTFLSGIIMMFVLTLSSSTFYMGKNKLQHIVLIQFKESTTPDQFIVHSLFPNPFNSFTTIRIFSEKVQTVTIQTFDLFGRELERENNISIQPGFTELQWEGKDYPSSIYFLKISSSSSFYYKKLILLK